MKHRGRLRRIDEVLKRQDTRTEIVVIYEPGFRRFKAMQGFHKSESEVYTEQDEQEGRERARELEAEGHDVVIFRVRYE